MTRTLRAAAAFLMTASGMMAVGCTGGPGLQARFQDVNNNNSWPERYNYQTRQAVLYPFEVQTNNAVAADGVILNAFFDDGTDKLNGVGRDKLNQLARKMPAANPTIYLQTANDVAFDEKAPDKAVAARAELDNKRQATVLAYLGTRPATRGTPFSVTVLDNADTTTQSTGPASAVRGLSNSYRSGVTGGFAGGNPLGAGGGQATNTVGVAASPAGPAQGGNMPPPSGGGTGGSGPLLR